MVAAPGSGGMRVNFAVTGVNHQPFKVRLINQYFEEALPYSLIAPTDESLMHSSPSPVFRRQVAPWRPCAQYPKNGVDKQTVVFCYSTPLPALSRQVRF